MGEWELHLCCCNFCLCHGDGNGFVDAKRMLPLDCMTLHGNKARDLKMQCAICVYADWNQLKEGKKIRLILVLVYLITKKFKRKDLNYGHSLEPRPVLFTWS